jgi:hypothetical protein
VVVGVQHAWNRVVEFVTRAPENSMIGQRRRLLSDRVWFGLAFIVAGLGSVGTVGGWWKAINFGAVAVGAMLISSGARRFQLRVRADNAKLREP